jgi:8-oxo-dGTP pyrophosphatase MutT (NUDIX family)
MLDVHGDKAQLETRLRDRLGVRLPGSAAQLRMAQQPRRGWRPDVYPEGCRQAAGLLLLFPTDDGLRVLLTLRRHDLPDHGGQVSLPGGELEPDETRIEAALREAHEEVGIDPALVTVLGPLTPLHIPVSNFVLHPFVGTTARRPPMQAAASEVARILEPQLDHLADPAHHGVVSTARAAATQRVPFFQVDNLRVWGATAMILAEFLALLDVAPNPWNETPAAQ